LTLEALIEAVRLKRLARAGWVRVGVPGPESVAAHSWGVSLLVVAFASPAIREKALMYAALHDLPEVRVGDLTPADGVSRDEKHRRERVAMVSLAPELLAIWDDYEAQADDAARFVRECDRLDMAIQALAYHREGAVGMREFVESARKVVRDTRLMALMDAVVTEIG
jgi:putative hydrolase of HD superfamily